MKPLVSIVIPCFNHAPALLRSLASVAKQTYRPLEVVVVDDGSVISLQTIESQIQGAVRDISLTLYRQENKGAPAARNKGASLSHGDYVFFWDADVSAHPSMVEKMYTRLSTTSASFAYSNFFLAQWWGRKKMRSAEFSRERLKQNNFIHSTSLIKRSEVIPWDESLKRFQDWDYWLTLGEQGKKGVWIDEFLFTVENGGTMSSWLPRFAYRAPWRWLPGIRSRVVLYERGKNIVQKKHALGG